MNEVKQSWVKAEKMGYLRNASRRELGWTEKNIVHEIFGVAEGVTCGEDIGEEEGIEMIWVHIYINSMVTPHIPVLFSHLLQGLHSSPSILTLA